MSLYLYLFQGDENTYSGYMPSNTWTPQSKGRTYAHVELRIGQDTVITRDGADTTFVTDWKNTPKEVTVVRIKLPHTDADIKNILRRRSELRLAAHPYRYRDFTYAARNSICPKSYFKKGFTCATMAAYLLGFKHYYAMCPDDIWQAMFTGVQEIDYCAR